MTTSLHAPDLSSFKTDAEAVCPACGGRGLPIFYEVGGVPVHSCLMLDSEREALDFPVGDIALGLCPRCGFITNTLYDPVTAGYAPNYEDQQSFSPTFNQFARSLASRLIEKHSLRGKQIVEIGCSKGDFLLLMCELSGGRGVGIDPSAVAGRVESEAADRVTFIQDYYSEKYAEHRGDLVACRHTLEHIHPVADFVRTVRRAVGEGSGTVVFFELPDTTRVLQERAFWDVYYEHCSYFTPGSLARLFRRCGFEVTAVERDYGDQYLLLEARVRENQAESDGQENGREIEESAGEAAALAAAFAARVRERLDAWRGCLRRARAQGRKVAVWGSGSKCVAFLTTLGAADEVGCVVDINPHRWGKFIPGVGKEIVPPDFLKTYRPDEVIVMNPIYRDEISRSLDALGVRAEVVPV
jgi:SAM-dependent methyltransferase